MIKTQLQYPNTISIPNTLHVKKDHVEVILPKITNFNHLTTNQSLSFIGKKDFSTQIIPEAKINFSFNASNEDYNKSLKMLYWNMLAENINKTGFKAPKNRRTEVLSMACGDFKEFDTLQKFFSKVSRFNANVNNSKNKANVVGLEIDPARIDFGKERDNSTNILQGDCTKLNESFGNKKFDVIVFTHPQILSVLIHTPDPNTPKDDPIYDDIKELRESYGDLTITETTNEADPEFLAKAKNDIGPEWPKMIQEAHKHLDDNGILIASTYTEAEYHLLKELLQENNFNIKVSKYNQFSKPTSNDTTLFNHYKTNKFIIMAKKA